MPKIIFSLIVGLFLSFNAQARLHEVELHSNEALVQFSSETVVNVEGNYLFELNSQWQLLAGGKYERMGSDSSRVGLTLGGVYNFGATDHNEKFYIKPQVTFAYYQFQYFYSSGGTVYADDDSNSTTFISLVFGKRFPIFTGGAYTLNYTPSIGVSVPVTNTDIYDTVFSLSLIGLSLVF